ncbi:MAG: JAB domain-containing protein [Nitrospirota bacterium]
MPKKPIARKKNAAVKKKQKPAYLREIQIKYKKMWVKAGSPVGKRITGARQVYELFSDLQNEGKEKLITISLDVRLKIICFEVVAIGSLCAVYARPVETLRAAIPLNPYGIIIVHNHPSGETHPSHEDKEFTGKLIRSAADLGVVFHDHIIIGDGDYFSFSEAGLMAKL